MTPEAAVNRLADILAERAEFTEDEAYAAMAAAGVPDAVADRAYKFTQTAWARAFLDGLGIRFAPDYLCFNGAGDVVESGLLADEPYYAAATAAARRDPRPAGLPRLALLSADLNAINSALKNGSKPENIATGPTALFLEPPTPAGLDKARQVLSQRIAALRNQQ